MADKKLGVETLSELQIWIEGQFALIAQKQDTAHNDLSNVRKTVHDLANQMAVIIAMNLPEKIAQLQEADKNHEINIERFIKEAAERRGMISAFRALYAIGGIVIGWIASLAFEIYKTQIGR